MSKILKAVIPAAGLGTRFSPITNAIPKELLPVVDRASIQYVVDEACEAGIEEIIIVISEAKESIRYYFDRLASTTPARIKYVYQQEQLGLGHAIFCCSEVIGQEPFAVLLPDDIIYNENGALKQLLELYSKVDSSVIAVQRVPSEFISSFLNINSTDIEISNEDKKIKKYVPLSKRQDKPDSALWLIKNHPQLKDSQIARLVSITKNSVTAIRNKSYWNFNNLNPKDPVAMSLFSQKDLISAIEKAERRIKREKSAKKK